MLLVIILLWTEQLLGLLELRQVVSHLESVHQVVVAMILLCRVSSPVYRCFVELFSMRLLLESRPLVLQEFVGLELCRVLALELDWLLLRLAEAGGGLLLENALLRPGLAF